MLSGRGIKKSFGSTEVLKGIDIDIAPGEIVCLIGPSGTGKTTLLRALALLDYPDSGAVSIEEKKYEFPLGKKEKITPPWPEVTVVFQSLFLWPHLTLRENIMLPARNRSIASAPSPRGGEGGARSAEGEGGKSVKSVENDLAGLINLFEMEHFIDNHPNEASLGQRQRVALARALILNPKYILLDEITSALDVEQTGRILTKLTHLKERGIGVFLITHAIGFAQRAADKIIFMDDGQIVEQGPPSILGNPGSGRLRNFVSLIEAAR